MKTLAWAMVRRDDFMYKLQDMDAYRSVDSQRSAMALPNPTAFLLFSPARRTRMVRQRARLQGLLQLGKSLQPRGCPQRLPNSSLIFNPSLYVVLSTSLNYT